MWFLFVRLFLVIDIRKIAGISVFLFSFAFLGYLVTVVVSQVEITRNDSEFYVAFVQMILFFTMAFF